MQVDWRKLAIDLGATQIHGSQVSLEAIETLLGEDFFAQAVDCCIELDEGWGLAEGVLRRLRPLGMKHCYTIYKTSPDVEKRRSAVWLLKYTSDRKVLEYIPEFLADPDTQIQRHVVEILDQMFFWREINEEEMISVLELAGDHPNEEVRKFAIGIINEETLQGIPDFTKRFTDGLQQELYYWQKRLKFETIHSLDLRCVPWYGQLQMSFLTAQEDFDLSAAYSDENYSKWRLDDLPYHGDEMNTLGKWMKKEFEKSRPSLQFVELFLDTCVIVLRSARIQKTLRKYNLSQDFQITVFSPNSSFPQRNFYIG